jgi:hypothetical protein
MGQLDTGGELPATTRPVGGPPADRVPAPHHANGVNGLDHLVVATPDLDRTVAALTGAGLDLRRTRDAGPGSGPDGARRMQAFFRLGGTILEVVGIEGAHGGGQATFWGLAFTVDDLDATATFLGDRLGPARDAVQPGRRIATLRRDAGSSVAMAFMSPAGRR